MRSNASCKPPTCYRCCPSCPTTSWSRSPTSTWRRWGRCKSSRRCHCCSRCCRWGWSSSTTRPWKPSASSNGVHGRPVENLRVGVVVRVGVVAIVPRAVVVALSDTRSESLSQSIENQEVGCSPGCWCRSS
jgi:hypothetical protein